MGGLKFSVHPLFFAFGFYYALTGKIFVFAIYTICAVVHELGHSFVATSVGYKLNKITLMPFGAVVSGNIEGLRFNDEIKIALGGPMINLIIGLLFVATWWLFPETYAFTDVVANANFSLAIINLLPIFPLDGGRVLCASLTGLLGKKKANLMCKIIGLIFALFLCVCFVISVFNQINLSLLFFSAFVLAGVFMKSKENEYVKIYTVLSEENLKRGMIVRRIAVHKSVTIKKVLSLLDDTCLNEVAVYDGESVRAVLSQKRIGQIIEKGNIYSRIEDYV